MAGEKRVTIYTDGACEGNPGPGGYGIVMMYDGHRRELSAGYRLTTNNRMEILAVIRALEALTERCAVTVHSDSRYVIDGIEKGWAARWRANGWMRAKRQAAINPDLWGRLLELCDAHDVTFRWVPGHSGIAENERCDRLAVQAARSANLQTDEAYESGASKPSRRPMI